MTVIEQLVSELKSLRRAYVTLLESGRDRILDLGGTCDPVDVMEAGNPHLASAVKAIAAGEAELRREPDGFLLTYTQTGASTLRRTRPTKWERASWTFEPVYTREETK